MPGNKVAAEMSARRRIMANILNRKNGLTIVGQEKHREAAWIAQWRQRT